VPMGRRAGSGGTTCGWSSRRRPSRMDSGVPPVAATACSRVGLVYVGCVRVCARVRARVRACVWACVCGMLRAGLRVWIVWGLGVCAIPRCTDSKVRIVKGARRALAARRGGSRAACERVRLCSDSAAPIALPMSVGLYDAIRSGGVRRDRLRRKGAAVLDDAHATQRMPRRRHEHDTMQHDAMQHTKQHDPMQRCKPEHAADLQPRG
jgi:hypothetical protein